MNSILISDKCSDDAIELLKKSGHTVVYNPEITPEQLLVEIPQHEALIVRGRTIVTQEVIAAGAKLKVIGRAGSGVDTIDVGAAKEKNIVVVNAPGANSETVAQHAITLMLALARSIVPISTALKAGRWEKKTYKGLELAGKTLGIVGFGAIGIRVAQIAVALGMKIIVFTRTQSAQKQALLNDVKGKFVSLEELLKSADYITLHVSGGNETRNMISSDQLRMMKKTAYFINCSRGSVVDEAALTVVLQSSMIAGAALDVFATEPLDAASPLLKLENILLTPHVAAVSPEATMRATMMVSEDVNRVLNGETAQHAV